MVGDVRGRRRPRARALRLLVRALPALVGRLRGRARAAAALRRARLRRRLPAADPSDRRARTARAATTRETAKPGDAGSPWAIGSEEGGHDAIDPELGTVAEFRVARRRREGARDRDRARLRDPVLARPPVAEGASRVVQPPPGRHAEVRREPAEALPGHLQRRLRLRGLARALAGAARRRAPLGRPRRHGVPRRQPAHEAGRRSGSG